MHWDYPIIAAAIAASPAYLAQQRVLRKYARNSCGFSSSGCACCPQASAKHHGARNDD